MEDRAGRRSRTSCAGGRGGSVIITSSSATAMISANIAHYTASKYGLIGLMRVLAKELAPHRIRVNTLHPTGVRTPMILNEPMYRLFRPDLDHPTREDFESSARTHHALGSLRLEPADVSAAVLYLAAPSRPLRHRHDVHARRRGGSLT